MLNIPKIPEAMLINEVVYYPFTGVDSDDFPLYGTPITFNKVRFDDSLMSSADLTETSEEFSAVCFMYRDFTSPFPSDIIRRSKLVFNGNDYVIKNVINVLNPFKNETWAFEIEVV